MKKIALILALSIFSLVGISFPYATHAQDDLAIGDPMTPGWKRQGKRAVKKTTTEEAPSAATPAEPAKPAEPAQPAQPKAEEPTKPAEPAQPAEPAKPAEPPAKSGGY